MSTSWSYSFCIVRVCVCIRGRLKKRGPADKAYRAKLEGVGRPLPFLVGMLSSGQLQHSRQLDLLSTYPLDVQRAAMLAISGVDHIHQLESPSACQLNVQKAAMSSVSNMSDRRTTVVNVATVQVPTWLHHYQQKWPQQRRPTSTQPPCSDSNKDDQLGGRLNLSDDGSPSPSSVAEPDELRCEVWSQSKNNATRDEPAQSVLNNGHTFKSRSEIATRPFHSTIVNLEGPYIPAGELSDLQERRRVLWRQMSTEISPSVQNGTSYSIYDSYCSADYNQPRLDVPPGTCETQYDGQTGNYEPRLDIPRTEAYRNLSSNPNQDFSKLSATQEIVGRGVTSDDDVTGHTTALNCNALARPSCEFVDYDETCQESPWQPQQLPHPGQPQPLRHYSKSISYPYNSTSYSSTYANSAYNGSMYNNSAQYNSKQYSSAPYNSTQFNSAQYNSTQYSSLPYNSAQFNSAQYNSAQYRSAQYNSAQYNSAQYNSTQFNSTQYNTSQFNQTISNQPNRAELICWSPIPSIDDGVKES